jgi:hypothetical protein
MKLDPHQSANPNPQHSPAFGIIEDCAVSAFVIPSTLASQTSPLNWLGFGFWNYGV